MPMTKEEMKELIAEVVQQTASELRKQLESAPYIPHPMHEKHHSFLEVFIKDFEARSERHEHVARVVMGGAILAAVVTAAAAVCLGAYWMMVKYAQQIMQALPPQP